jgi:dTDP-4-dehydrorhamnose 3,5-epimerase
MGAMSLDEILISKLTKINNINGDILKIIKKSDENFKEFGEAYLSSIKFKAIKGWKLHSQMIMNLVVPVGSVRFVFFLDDDKTEKNFRIEELSGSKGNRLTIPPGIWFGFQGLSKPDNLVLNIASMEHDENEIRRKELNEIKFSW